MRILALFVLALAFSSATNAQEKSYHFFLRVLDLGQPADASCNKKTLDLQAASCSVSAGSTEKEIALKNADQEVLLWNGAWPNGDASSAMLKGHFHFQGRAALLSLNAERGLDAEIKMTSQKKKLIFGHWTELATVNRGGKKIKLLGRVTIGASK